MPWSGLLAAIPSPSSGNLGPFHMYGIILAVGVLVAVWVSERRWRNRGYPRDGIYDIAFWVVVWGVVGARLYHVVTDYQLFTDDPLRAFAIWRGGLGIWGAVLGGGIAVVVITRRRHYDTLAVMDCMAPGIILAQAIGRWGNYFNQELFGKPSTWPWALEIAQVHRPLGYTQYATFQPTFLYESLYCLAVFGILLAIEHKWRLKRGQTFALYVMLYTFGRFWFENMRIDPAHHVAGLRINAWVSIGVFLLALGWFVWLGRNVSEQRRPLVRPPVDLAALQLVARRRSRPSSRSLSCAPRAPARRFAVDTPRGMDQRPCRGRPSRSRLDVFEEPERSAP